MILCSPNYWLHFLPVVKLDNLTSLEMFSRNICLSSRNSHEGEAHGFLQAVCNQNIFQISLKNLKHRSVQVFFNPILHDWGEDQAISTSLHAQFTRAVLTFLVTTITPFLHSSPDEFWQWYFLGLKEKVIEEFPDYALTRSHIEGEFHLSVVCWYLSLLLLWPVERKEASGIPLRHSLADLDVGENNFMWIEQNWLYSQKDRAEGKEQTNGYSRMEMHFSQGGHNKESPEKCWKGEGEERKK